MIGDTMTRQTMINTYKREKKMKNLKKMIRSKKFVNLKNMQVKPRQYAA